jgi:DNA replication protein DnaC
MALDGKALSRARARLDEIKAANEAELSRRQRQVYALLPRVKEIDKQLRLVFTRVLGVAISHSGDTQQELAKAEAESVRLRAEKAEILAEAGFAPDYLEEIYSCEKCRDSGFDRSGHPCSCLMELYRREQAQELSSLLKVGQDDFSDFDLSYYSPQPDERYGVSPRENMELVLNTCRSYAANFRSNSQNLLLRGGTGLGKTFLSACIAKSVATQGFSVIYDTAVSVFESFERSKFSRDADVAAAAGEVTSRMLSCDLMILDDLGTEMTTSFTQSALYTLINTRLNQGRKTIINTNLSQQEMSERYTGQIISRIEGEFDTLLFLGRDIRAVKKERRYE